MFEMSAAELESEMGVELPDREIMHGIRVKVSHSFNNNLSIGNVTSVSLAANVKSKYATATATSTVVFMITQNNGISL